MLAREARDIALDWLETNTIKMPNFVGAFLSGSIAWMQPDEPLRPGSDIDIFVVIDGSELPPKPGKIPWNDAILEINYLSLEGIADVDAVLSDYHLAGAFRRDGILADPTGTVTALRRQIDREFARPYWVQQRCSQARNRAQQRVIGFRDGKAIHDRVTTLFFGAGLCPHMILVTDLANPTIRRRYAASGLVLKRRSKPDLHERLLSTLGSKTWSRQRAEKHLADLAEVFDLACSVLRSPYRFASDMSVAARPIAIDGSLDMIQSGFHREAAFWLIAIMSRSRAVVAMDGSSDQMAWMDKAYWRLLHALDIENEQAMNERAEQALSDITVCWDWCCEVLNSMEQLGSKLK